MNPRELKVDYQEITTTKLSKREDEVVQALITGKSAKEIADSCFMSVHTVNTHLQRIRNKWSAKNNVHIAVKYLRNSSIAIIFLAIQGRIMISEVDSELRRPLRTKVTRKIKNHKKWEA